MKRFEAFYTGSELLELQNGVYVRNETLVFDIISESEDRANGLISEKGYNTDEFKLEEISGVKDQMGDYFSESISFC